MAFDYVQRQRVGRYLAQFDFANLFFEELGWDAPPKGLRPEVHTLEETVYTFRRVSHKRDFYLFVCEGDDGQMPDSGRRGKLETWLSKRNREHITIYVDGDRREQVWSWVQREPGRPVRRFFHRYSKGQVGESLIQRLERLKVTWEDEENITLVEMSGRVRAAFNVERATKKFYDQFKKERNSFEAFVLGIPDIDKSKEYVSVMLNRLMFVYFIQRKGLLDGDGDYLRNRLRRMQQRHGDDQFYSFYRYFLLRLFHEGLGEPDRDDELEALIGKVPYLNGGIFQEHKIENDYADIQISDEAFEQIFDFFDQYQWHLDDRPLRDDSEINPDVLGYIFEKYINQKQMGAYYTKEDITEYISKNTIIPFLFDEAQKDCAIAFSGEQSLWQLAQADPDRYIYTAVRQGTELPLPEEIAAGVDDVSQRGGWNMPTPEAYALPTEIWRETVARRQRYERVRAQLAAGEVRGINEFITLNLDIQQLAQDVIENSEGPELLRAFWRAINRVSILDPTCGSGAFLFAALNILQPLYEACLERMAGFVADLGPTDSPQKYSDFKKVLAQVAQHPNQDYYVLKSIVVNNLYGVDIMAEAVEIAKLRLFLKLVAQVQTIEQIEPLPDIDFNIREGNTLVGFTSPEEVRQAMAMTQTGQGRLMFGEDQAALAQIEEKAADVDRLFGRFRQMQTSGDAQEFDAADFVETKKRLQGRLAELEAELNRHLARQYDVDPDKPQSYQKWLTSHEPFHWFVEFYGILKQGGFDVIIGNPPYVELRALKEYSTRGYVSEKAGNLYALTMERCLKLCALDGRSGFIVPVSSVSTARYISLQQLLKERELFYSSFDDRPSRLFDGLQHIRLTIHLIGKISQQSRFFSTRYNKWSKTERSVLFDTLRYAAAPFSLIEDSLPKLTSELEVSILNKIKPQPRLARFFVKTSKNKVLYSRKVGYFLQVLNFEPRVLDGNGNLRHPSEFKELSFATKAQADIALCTLNSSLFYWFVTVFSDCRHLNKREVNEFPIDLANLEKRFEGENLSDLATLLANDLSEHSEDRVMKFSHDTLTIQCIIPKHSKGVIDQIDEVLAKYYGFTDEELDFIINYDIKYRLGDDLFDDDVKDE